MRFSRFIVLFSLAVLFLASHTTRRVEMFRQEKQSPPVQQPAATQAAQQSSSTTGKLVAPKVFHIAGIREVPRNARGDLTLTAGELTFQQGKKQRLLLPFDRIQRVQFFAGDRNYEKAAYGAAVATLPIGGLGALLILKEHKVAIFVFDYGKMRRASSSRLRECAPRTLSSLGTE